MTPQDNLAEKLQEIVENLSMDTEYWPGGFVSGRFNHEELLTDLTIYITDREEQIRADAFEKGREYERNK